MQMTAIILADILFLAIMVFTVSLDRRSSRIETRSRRELGRLSERVWQLQREVDTVSGSVAEMSAAAKNAESAVSRRNGEEERRFNEAVANILGYGIGSARDDTEDEK